MKKLFNSYLSINFSLFIHRLIKIFTAKISEDTLYFEGEKNFKNIRQLTFMGRKC